RPERRNFASQVVDQNSEADDRETIGNKDEFDVGAGIDIAVDVAGKRDVLLPKDDPVARKDEQEKHEPRIGEHGYEIPKRFGNAGSGSIVNLAGLAEEKQNHEKHGKDTEGGHTKDVFHTEMAVCPGGHVGPGLSAIAPPKMARNQTIPPKIPASVPVCSVGKFSFSWR